MAKSYSVTITNGTGTSNVLDDTYTATTTVTGYDNTTLSPTSITVVDGTNNYAFTVGATGTLTLHVTETGETTGTPIVGATFIRTDASGITYGDDIVSDSNGDAVFNNVPYDATNPVTVYFQQIASDGSHSYTETVQNTTLSTSTTTVEIENPLPALRTFSVTDENYANLPVSGTLSLN